MNVVLQLVTCTLSCVVSTQPETSSRIPVELLTAAAKRTSFETALVHWVRHERAQASEHAVANQYYTSQYAPGGDEVLTYHGDEQGCPHPRSIGMMGACAAIQRLTTSQGVRWSRVEMQGQGRRFSGVYDRPYRRNGYPQLWDLRSLGLSPRLYLDDRPETHFDTRSYLRFGGDWSVGRDGDLIKVTMTLDPSLGEHRVTWWIDPERGGNIVRSLNFTDGVEHMETVTEYKQYDGKWFPCKITDWLHTEYDEPYSVTEVLYAEFDRPSHPRSFTPDDIGFTTGMFVEVFGPQEPGRGENSFRYIGHGQLMPPREFTALRKADSSRFDTSNYDRLMAINSPHGPTSQPMTVFDESWSDGTASRHPGLWEQYVVRFIQTYRLDVDQRKKAWKLLAEAQERAHDHYDEHRDEFDDLRQRIADANQRNAAAEASRHEERYVRMSNPFDTIFHKWLVRGLEALLTKDQREIGDKIKSDLVAGVTQLGPDAEAYLRQERERRQHDDH